MRFAFLFATIALIATPAFAAEGESFTGSGTWNNKRYGTRGPLNCVAESKDGKTWKATFTGKFRRSPFKFNAKFAGTKAKGRTNLKGTAIVDGDRYQWAGSIKGNVLNGQFRSQKGYFGNFTLRKAAGKKSQ